MTIKVFLLATTRSSTRQLYEASVEGEDTPIVAGSWDPDSDVCRVLKARGETGRVEFWRPGKDFAALIVRDLVKYATTQTSEPARGPLTRRKFDVMPDSEGRKGAPKGATSNTHYARRLVPADGLNFSATSYLTPAAIS